MVLKNSVSKKRMTIPQLVYRLQHSLEHENSVVDAVQLFGQNIAGFMKRNGYTYEHRYIEVIQNWRRACDECGLSELQRCRFNYGFLNLILDELMPWHKDVYGSKQVYRLHVDCTDLCTRATCPCVCIHVCTCIYVSADQSTVFWGFQGKLLLPKIEGREWCRRLNRLGKPEHPRASTSDDVECFFSMMRDALGQSFTPKEVQYGF